MQSACELVTMITAIAILITEGRSESELALIAAIFVQLGDTIVTINEFNATCCQSDEPEPSTYGL